MKFDGVIVIMNGLEDLIYNRINVVQLSFITEQNVMQSKGVLFQNVFEASQLSCDFEQLTVT